MSTLKNQTVQEIFEAIKVAKGFRKNTELANFVGTTKQNINNWSKRNSIGDFNLFTLAGLNEHFMRTGKGPMFAHELGHHLLSHAPDPEQQRADALLAGNFPVVVGEEAQQQKEPEPTRLELHNMIDTVLDSDTVYRPALRSNIVAFDKAVRQEVKMNTVEERMERMEGMLKKLLEERAPEKKSEAA